MTHSNTWRTIGLLLQWSLSTLKFIRLGQHYYEIHTNTPAYWLATCPSDNERSMALTVRGFCHIIIMFEVAFANNRIVCGTSPIHASLFPPRLMASFHSFLCLALVGNRCPPFEQQLGRQQCLPLSSFLNILMNIDHKRTKKYASLHAV